MILSFDTQIIEARRELSIDAFIAQNVPRIPCAMSTQVMFALRGAPGIGKSTVASLLAAQCSDLHVIEVDHLRARHPDGDWLDRDFHDRCLAEAAGICGANTEQSSVVVDVMGRHRWSSVRQHWLAAGHRGVCISLIAQDQAIADRHRSRLKRWGDTSTVLAINQEIRSSRAHDELSLDSSVQEPSETAAKVLEVIHLNRVLSTKSHTRFNRLELTHSSPIASLTATRNRLALLSARALASVARQDRKPEICVIVNDGPSEHRCQIEALASRIGVRAIVLQNDKSSGVAGAWNTGLEHLRRSGFAGFVAMLDDDDEWDRDHLSANLAAATRSEGNFSISGLRLSRNSRIVDRPLIESLSGVDFLVGNPGWQGSNTFIDLGLLLSVGGFDERLDSMHDRDLSIRVLTSGRARPALIPQFTATWHIGTEGALSAPGSPQKLNSLRRFWDRYGCLMTYAQREQFFGRTEQLFSISKSMIDPGVVAPCDESLA